jgi:N-acetylmuramoyl-L-alanine amidase
VVSTTYLLRQENSLVSLIMFSEDNGQAQLLVQGRMPLLAKFSADRKTIDIVAAPGEAENQPAGTPAAVVVPAPPTLQSLTAKPPFVVMLDAGHGGDDRGAMLSETLEEKTVTLAFARRLRNELQSHGINAIMTRDADVTVPVEQRAAMADASRVAVYLGLHATSQGHGVKVYTAMLNSASSPEGTFLAWDTAQSKYMLSSRALADITKAELGKHEIPSSALSAPVQPLNHVAAAALAIEIAPPSTETGSVNAGVYQQRVAAALAEAIVVGRSRVEAEQ